MTSRYAKRNAAFRRRWSQLLRDLRDEMIARGATDPQLFVEGSAGLYVTNGSVWTGGPEGSRTFAEGDERAINLPWPAGVNADCGGW